MDGRKAKKYQGLSDGNSENRFAIRVPIDCLLPAAGYRNDTNLNNVGSNGNYWSSWIYGPLHPAFEYGYFAKGILKYKIYRWLPLFVNG